MALSLLLKTLRESSTRKLKQKLFIIPFLFTFLNAFFGLLSVINTINEHYYCAAYCILCAVCMDFFDGRLARAFNSCSYVGMELDSLCDAVSFCFAPAILLYGWSLHGVGSWALLAVGSFLCSGLFRLAKFNACAMNQKSYFIGLPTTIAACFIASVVLAAPWLAQHHAALFVSPVGIIGLLVALSLLMPSSLRFSSLKKFHVRSMAARVCTAIGIFVGLWLMSIGCPLFFLATALYILGNMLMNLFVYRH